MKKVLLALSVVVTGCASPQQRLDAAMSAPEWEVCYVAISGNGPRQAANQAIQARGINCSQHMPMIQARMAQDANNAALGASLIRAGQPRPAPAPVYPVNCRTVWVGGGYNTVCD